MIDPELVPLSVIESLERYTEHRIPTGSFLRAVLENNLKEAVGKADYNNIRLLPEIVWYCYNKLPSNCWGNPAKVKKFLEGK